MYFFASSLINFMSYFLRKSSFKKKKTVLFQYNFLRWLKNYTHITLIGIFSIRIGLILLNTTPYSKGLLVGGMKKTSLERETKRVRNLGTTNRWITISRTHYDFPNTTRPPILKWIMNYVINIWHEQYIYIYNIYMLCISFLNPWKEGFNSLVYRFWCR